MDPTDSTRPRDGQAAVCDFYRIKWKGCDWPTKFGSRKLNLCGLSSRQARIAANATRCEEAECWRAATEWLAAVESDAATARRQVMRAAVAERRGDLTAAERWLVAAAEIESRYRSGGEIQALLERFRGQSGGDHVAESLRGADK